MYVFIILGPDGDEKTYTEYGYLRINNTKLGKKKSRVGKPMVLL